MNSRWAVAGMVCLLLGCGTRTESETAEGAPETMAARDPGPPVVLDRKENLWLVYDGNEAAADKKFLGRTVEFSVSGPVKKSADGHYYIAGIVSGAPDDFAPGLVCHLAPASLERVRKARPYVESVNYPAFRVRGICQGRSASPAAFKRYAVVVKDCQILANVYYVNNTWKEE
jgi:hypothetical protein